MRLRVDFPEGGMFPAETVCFGRSGEPCGRYGPEYYVLLGRLFVALSSVRAMWWPRWVARRLPRTRLRVVWLWYPRVLWISPVKERRMWRC